jgi:hypothetical protein
MSSLEKMLAQAERTTKGGASSANNRKFDLNNYFTTHLPKGVDSGTKRVRIIGIEEETPFVEAYAHSKRIDGEWKTLFCPQHEDGEPCPFCEVRDGFLKKKDDEDAKQLARENQARLVYIVKVIDRDNESHGPKFWRFKRNWEKKGVYDKILGLVKVYGDVANNQTGRDLIVQIDRNTKGAPTVTNIIAADPSPLSEDASKVKEWTEDEKTWRDVYGVKRYEYLEVAVKGYTPIYDKEKETYVAKELADLDTNTSSEEKEDVASELRMGAANAEAPKAAVAEAPTTETKVEAEVKTTTSETEAPTGGSEEEDDLPW